MTEWHGIEVGGLYKKTGKGSRGAPLVFVLGFERHGNPYADCVYMLSTVGERVVKSFMVDDESGRLLVRDDVDEAGQHDTIYHNGWPYKRMSA